MFLFSQSTTDAQKRSWCPYRLEMAALALSLKAYESLLLHLPITVFTDNSVVLNIRKYDTIEEINVDSKAEYTA